MNGSENPAGGSAPAPPRGVADPSPPAPFRDDDLLPIAALQHLIFCERQCALMYIEGIWEENRYTVEGAILHERVDSAEGETRRDCRIARSVRIRSLSIGLVGIADLVEFHRCERDDDPLGAPLDGLTGRWRPFPVEYKRGRPKIDDRDRVQLCAQAFCLEEMLGVPIPAGAIFYGEPRRRAEVAFDTRLRGVTLDAVRRLRALIESGETPPARFDPKCHGCSLIELCLPAVTDRHRSAAAFLDGLIAKEGRA